MREIGSILRRRVVLLATATTVGLLAMAGAASAQTTITVNDTTDAALANPEGTSCVSTDNGSCTLRAAVQTADNLGGSSTISLPAGTYTLTIPSTGPNDPSTGDLDILETSVTITGAGSGSTIINANGIDRAFTVRDGASLTLSGMTIENGQPSGESYGSLEGGAIYTDGALTITGDVTMSGDSAPNEGGSDGGAIYADTDSTLSVTGATFNQDSALTGGAIFDDSSSAATISKSTFNVNVASQINEDDDNDGGAIYGEGSGNLTVDSTTFSGNDAEYGGGIYWGGDSAVTVTNSTFTDNHADWEYGGAINDQASSSMTLSNDTFTSNTAGYAGALYLDSNAESGAYTLNQDEFAHNTATYDGGAVNWANGTLTSSGSSFIDNTAGLGGGLVDESDGNNLSLVNDTMSHNTATSGGGLAFFDADVPITMTNDTIADNTADSGQGGGIYGTFNASTDAETGSTGVLNTIVADNTGGDCGNGFGDSDTQFSSDVDAGNNLDSDSSCFGTSDGPVNSTDKPGVDPMLGQAADNGGPSAGAPGDTETIETDAELIGSPAIDAGTNTGCPGTDARGITRPQGAACDIGAFEWAAAPLSLGKSAPSTATTGNPFTYTLTASNAGPGFSTGTAVTDQLPAGETLLNVSSSQGSCTSAGTPANVTCALGIVNSGQNATVTITVAEANAGSVTNTATATNDQGSNANGSATTQVSGPPTSTVTVTSPPPPSKRIELGSLRLDNTRLAVSNGTVSVPFTCQSAISCLGRFTITKTIRVANTFAFGPLVCTKPSTGFYLIAAGKTMTIKVPVTNACLELLRKAKNHQIRGQLSSGPRSGQAGVVKRVTLTGS